MNQKIADFLEIFQDTDKTIIMTILIALGTIFRAKGLIDSNGFVVLLQTTVVAYFGTSTVSHFTSMIKDHLADKLETIHTKDKTNEN